MTTEIDNRHAAGTCVLCDEDRRGHPSHADTSCVRCDYLPAHLGLGPVKTKVPRPSIRRALGRFLFMVLIILLTIGMLLTAWSCLPPSL